MCVAFCLCVFNCEHICMYVSMTCVYIAGKHDSDMLPSRHELRDKSKCVGVWMFLSVFLRTRGWLVFVLTF